MNGLYDEGFSVPSVPLFERGVDKFKQISAQDASSGHVLQEAKASGAFLNKTATEELLGQSQTLQKLTSEAISEKARSQAMEKNFHACRKLLAVLIKKFFNGRIVIKDYKRLLAEVDTGPSFDDEGVILYGGKIRQIDRLAFPFYCRIFLDVTIRLEPGLEYFISFYEMNGLAREQKHKIIFDGEEIKETDVIELSEEDSHLISLFPRQEWVICAKKICREPRRIVWQETASGALHITLEEKASENSTVPEKGEV